jgi:hypothetical protein
MAQLSYRRHRFPADIIQRAIWLYLRFTLSYRDVEELLAERGLDVSYETVRRWVLKFGPLIARKLRQGRPRPSARWHLDEMVVRIAGDESARCSASNRLAPPSASSACTLPYTTPSTFNAISSLGARFGSSEPRQPRSGELRLPSHKTGFDLADSLHPAPLP